MLQEGYVSAMLSSHSSTSTMTSSLRSKAESLLSEGQVSKWQAVNRMAENANDQEKAWQYFWDSLSAEKDQETGEKHLPKKGSKLYDLIHNTFVDYEGLREQYLKAVGVDSEYFTIKDRAEAV